MFSSTLQRRAGLQSSGDYTSYRKYASRRLKKLRQREGLVVKASKSYTPKPLSPGQWQLAMLQAERSWAAAMGARAALDADAAAPQALKTQISSKLAKSIKHAREARSLQAADASSREKLEFATYTALLAGELALEKQQWSKVSAEFGLVRVGLVALAGVSGDSANNTENVFGDLLTTSVDPALRLALAQQHEDISEDLSKVARRTVEANPEFAGLVRDVHAQALSNESAVSKVGSVQFRSHTAEVKYDTLAEILLKVRAKEQEVSSKLNGESHEDTGIFDEVLGEWNELEFVTSNLIAELNNAGRERAQDLDIILTYARFHLLYRRIQRDAIVATKERAEAGKAANAVRLYDVVLQSCDSMAELPGVYNDDELMTGITSMKKYFETMRTLTLASLHPQGSVEALALVDLAYRRLAESESSAVPDSVDLPISAKQAANLQTEVGRQLVRQHSLTVLYDEARNRSLAKGSIASDLGFAQVASAHKKLVVADLDVKHIDPVPVKPVFYDVAYNHVAEIDGADEATGAKKSLFGLF